MDIIWDGVTQPGILRKDLERDRQALADAAKRYDWPRVLELISKNPEMVNSTRLGGKSLFAPLHQAAHGGASIDVIDRLIGYGAWRTLQNANGERPMDIAERQGNAQLLAVLEPEYKHTVPIEVLLEIQARFHEVILEREGDLVQEHRLRLPELEPLLELEQAKMWFPVPMMYGGFSYWFETFGARAKLISESWNRGDGGSGQRHSITPSGSELTDFGFV